MTRPIHMRPWSAALLACCLGVLVGCATGRGSRGTEHGISRDERTMLLHLDREADLVVVCELRVFRIRRHAETPLHVVKVVRGRRARGRTIVACYHLTPATDSPPRGSRWIVCLKAPHRVEDCREYREVAGEPLAQNGIMPATASRVDFLRQERR